MSTGTSTTRIIGTRTARMIRRANPTRTGIATNRSPIGTPTTRTCTTTTATERRPRGGGASTSPFRGWWYWHHIAGLTFGLLTLTWVFSGLLTMNPWGLLEGSAASERWPQRLAGEPRMAELRQFLNALPATLPTGEFVQLRAQPLGGRLFVMAYRADGSALRLDAAGRPAPLTQEYVRQMLAGAGTPLAAFASLAQGDSFYYARGDGIELPVYRAILTDRQHTRLYISPTSGSVRVIDRDGRYARWLEDGLHDLDFPGLHARPLWDGIVLLLLAGVSVSCVTGGWMAIQRIRRDLGRSH